MTPTLRACALSFLAGLGLGLLPALLPGRADPGPCPPPAPCTMAALGWLAEQQRRGCPHAAALLDALPERPALDALARERYGHGEYGTASHSRLCAEAGEGADRLAPAEALARLTGRSGR